MTAAQKTAKAKFKQAIAYRQKTGVSLKEAFAHVYGKKVGAAPKKKATKKATPKKAAKKIGATTKKRKPISEQSVLNKIHKVKDQVNQLDELQHKHMSKLGSVSRYTMAAVKDTLERLEFYKKNLYNVNESLKRKHWHPNYKQQLKDSKKRYTDLIKETKIHLTQLKKHI